MGGAGTVGASSDSSSSSGSESGLSWIGKERPGGGSPGGGGMDKGRTERGAEMLPSSADGTGLALRALARSFFRDFTSLFGHKWQ